MSIKYSLAIDFGAKYIGIALIAHTRNAPNRVLYAAVIVVESKRLDKSVKPRLVPRGVRRTGKTRSRRLRRLAIALRGIRGAKEIVRFSRRRGFSYDRDEDDEAPSAQAVSRDEFFEALEREIDLVVPKSRRAYVLKTCKKHLNAERRPTAELRPARFDNRHPSQCQWEGCDRNVPRKKNAIREQLAQTLFVWLKPVYEQTRRKKALRQFVDRQIDDLVGLAHLSLTTDDRSRGSRFSKLKSDIFNRLLEGIVDACDEDKGDKFTENWKDYYQKQLNAIVASPTPQGGRMNFCREHSQQYVDYFLKGKVHPQQTEVRVSDLFGRTQQIVFQRIWRLIVARILPLCNGRIDRVVVERSAFDVLAGKFKDRVDASKDEDKAAEMYWHGPMFGYDSRLKMLKAEFDGRCAYCGRKRSLTEVEHIFPRSRFPFDSYFNLLPACRECNSQKGSRTPIEVGMTVHEKAFEEYSSYVASRKPPHVYHTIKKGMLKLMTHETGVAKAQRQLALLANNLVTITTTQKGPRPLARFVASRLKDETGNDCKPEWISGRHTAIYRNVLLPDWDKAEDKKNQGLVNHAVDAIIAGCRCPSVTRLENREWNIKPGAIAAWHRDVIKASPTLDEATKLPEVLPVERLEHFEQDLGNGYLQIDLSAFNWNQQRQSGTKLDPFGKTASGEPLKREKADNVLSALLGERGKDPATQATKQIDKIAHRGLRQLLLKHQSRKHGAARPFVRWLQETTRRGLDSGDLGNHPSDQARYAALVEFVNTPTAHYVRTKARQTKGNKAAPRKAIPETIGIRCLNNGVRGKLHVVRRNAADDTLQYFAADPTYRALYVGYRNGGNGKLDRENPIVLYVNQGYAVSRRQASTQHPVTDAEDSPLRGRILGDGLDRKSFIREWTAELANVLRELGVVKSFRITRGCYIEKTDGSGFQLRNFDTAKPWMRGAPFKNIHRVYRSPLNAVLKD